ncbi:ogr/Delta-like zinc finger family protein [Pantoea sp. AS-PWVM4]|uniref:ogr/Delta-like zinc finger family protein n=1 Tax=Pantoea sp. AS-PWVM4 TaxID=1332069 RepID=UPI0008FEF4E0|nr:ogr/Delta-like zinc finger family protein [Pantoea sp. AS-PWVM4]
MMNCPKCKHAAHTRSSVQLSENTKERYNQCQNINCGCTFKSLETVTDIIMCPGKVTPVPPHPSRTGDRALQGQLWL